MLVAHYLLFNVAPLFTNYSPPLSMFLRPAAFCHFDCVSTLKRDELQYRDGHGDSLEATKGYTGRQAQHFQTESEFSLANNNFHPPLT